MPCRRQTDAYALPNNVAMHTHAHTAPPPACNLVGRRTAMNTLTCVVRKGFQLSPFGIHSPQGGGGRWWCTLHIHTGTHRRMCHSNDYSWKRVCVCLLQLHSASECARSCPMWSDVKWRAQIYHIIKFSMQTYTNCAFAETSPGRRT